MNVGFKRRVRRFDGERFTGRVLRRDQAADAVQRDGRNAQPGGTRAGRAAAGGRAAVRDGRARPPRPAGRAVRGDGAVQPGAGGPAHPVTVPGRRGVPVPPARRPVRGAQRGQKVRGRQRAAVRGAQVLPASARAADQPAVRPGRQPGPIQRHVVHLGVVLTRPRPEGSIGGGGLVVYPAAAAMSKKKKISFCDSGVFTVFKYLTIMCFVRIIPVGFYCSRGVAFP